MGFALATPITLMSVRNFKKMTWWRQLKTSSTPLQTHLTISNTITKDGVRTNLLGSNPNLGSLTLIVSHRTIRVPNTNLRITVNNTLHPITLQWAMINPSVPFKEKTKKTISLVLRITQRKTRSSEKLDLVESERTLRQPFKLEPAKISSPGRLSEPIPTDPVLAPDNHRLYFPEDPRRPHPKSGRWQEAPLPLIVSCDINLCRHVSSKAPQRLTSPDGPLLL
ncbi:hypothetical protein PIB30_036233 [Stylosanthes scabra]|uniref:Uncharacterized protein n=1 Tax=Stylosanthes scabra TaxID=79078 RepID=A0ABU6WBM6_9FABA|nr:hypothetical protein [Stylosanthes scabra]